MVLEFDKKLITKEDMIERYNYYIELVNVGYELLESKDNKTAREILKTISDDLKEEYKYYTKVKVDNFIWKTRNRIIIDYVGGIRDAYAHIISANKYSQLHSNLWDVEYYLRHHFKKHIE